jgi:glycine/serine hydroxymethyltransferase
MGQTEMRLVADLLVRTLKARDDDDEIAAVRSEVAALCAAFPPYPDLLG